MRISLPFAATAALAALACASPDGASGGGDAGSFTPPMAVACEHTGSGTVYDVGDGQPYPALGDVPWYALGPGDTVRVHWRAQPYREKVLLSNSGAPGDPIRLCGVPGPGGELPVIDGNGAVTSPNQHWHPYLPLQDAAVVMVTEDDDDRYGTRTEYLAIEGLVIRGAYRDYTYTNSQGDVRNYDSFAAGLYITHGAHIEVRGNVFTDNGLGLFTLSKDETDAHVTEDILIEGNLFSGNGVVGEEARHNCYTQALGVVVQFNRFERLRDGAGGGNYKDRSAGTVFRYNWVEGGARQVDLVDAQEHVDHALADPRYRETFVYGNVILNDEASGDGGHIVHYGGDTLGFEQNFRKGTLYFFHNTVVTSADADDRYRTAVIEVSTNDETVDARNNVIVRHGTTHLALVGRDGQLHLGVNWVSDGYWTAYEDFGGSVDGEANLIAGADPGLDADLRPVAGSPLIDAAGPLADGAPPVDAEYAPPATGQPRSVRGAAMDLGAFEGG